MFNVRPAARRAPVTKVIRRYDRKAARAEKIGEALVARAVLAEAMRLRVECAPEEAGRGIVEDVVVAEANDENVRRCTVESPNDA